MTWPTSKLIHMTEATLDGNAIAPASALRRNGGSYLIIDGPYEGAFINPFRPGDTITDWEDQTIIPVGTLNTLRIAFQGVELSHFAHKAIQRTISYIPRDETTPVEKAAHALAEKTNEIGETTPHDYLAKLLAKLTSPSKAASYTDHLIGISAIGAAWLNTIRNNKDAVREIAEKAETLYRENKPATIQNICDSAHEIATSTRDDYLLTSALTNLAVRALALAARNDK